MAQRRRGHHRCLSSSVRTEELPEVRIDSAGTVLMSEQQHTAAVEALAVLIEAWRAAIPQPSAHEPGDEEARLAA